MVAFAYIICKNNLNCISKFTLKIFLLDFLNKVSNYFHINKFIDS